MRDVLMDTEKNRLPGIIEADDLTKTYNDMVAVSHIRFCVKKGEIFGFLGPNGAGKTTTMRMIECVSPAHPEC